MLAPMQFLKDISITKKLIFISSILSLPTLLLLVFFIESSDFRIDFANKEIKGAKLLQSVYPLQEDFAKHRGLMAGYLNGEKTFESAILEIENHLEKTIELLAKNEVMTSFDGQTQLLNIRNQWDKLSGLRDIPPKQSFQQHTQLIELTLELIVHIADHSNLTLDPEVDSSYLRDLAVITLPELFEALGKTRGSASGIVASGNLTEQNRILLTSYEFEIDRLLKQSKNDLNTAYRNTENSALRARLENHSKVLEDTIHTFLNLLENDVIQAQSMSISSEQVFSTGTAAIDAAKTLLNASSPELIDLLSARAKRVTLHKNTQLLIVTFCILLALTIGTLITNILRKQVNEVVSIISQSTQSKDLTVQAEVFGKDDIGIIASNLNEMITSFSKIIKEINSTSIQLSTVAEQTATTSLQSSENLAEQQNETAQLATAIHQMASTAEEVANSTVNAADAAGSVDKQASEGNSLVEQAVASIEELHNEVGRIGDILAKLNNSSNVITSVLDVIKNVAEQTNLLALNAAIEAARAGEQGRGFAVVADEVRSLAKRTQESAGEIEGIISTFQQDASNAYNIVEDSKGKVDTTVEKAKSVEKALVSIGIAIATIRDMNRQIAEATEETVSVNMEINRNVSRIDEMSQQTVTGSSEISQASKEQASLVRQLQQLASAFRI